MSPMGKVSAISAFCRPTTQIPSITNCLVAIALSKPVIANCIPKLVAMATSLSNSGFPSNTWFLGPVQAHNPNGISIGSVIFAGLTSVTNRPTDHTTRSVTIGHSYVRSTATRPNNKCWRWLWTAAYRWTHGPSWLVSTSGHLSRSVQYIHQVNWVSSCIGYAVTMTTKTTAIRYYLDVACLSDDHTR